MAIAPPHGPRIGITGSVPLWGFWWAVPSTPTSLKKGRIAMKRLGGIAVRNPSGDPCLIIRKSCRLSSCLFEPVSNCPCTRLSVPQRAGPRGVSTCLTFILNLRNEIGQETGTFACTIS